MEPFPSAGGPLEGGFALVVVGVPFVSLVDPGGLEQGLVGVRGSEAASLNDGIFHQGTN